MEKVSKYSTVSRAGLTVASTSTYLATVRRLNRGEPFVGRPTWLGVSIAAILAIVGALMSIYLLQAP